MHVFLEVLGQHWLLENIGHQNTKIFAANIIKLTICSYKYLLTIYLLKRYSVTMLQT